MLLAAVLVPVVLEIEPLVIFVRRAAHVRTHPGEIAFPGGMVDHSDGDDRRKTALRECEEELGVSREAFRIVTQLPETELRLRGVRVTPFVAVADPPLKLLPNLNEISEVLPIPLAAVLEPNAIHEGEEILPDRSVRTWQFDFKSLHVWGATGRILRDFAVRFGDCPDELSTFSEEGLRVGPEPRTKTLSFNWV